MASEFQLSEILSADDRSVFEPKVPDIVGNQSFAFCQTTGNRDAPEALVLELFREVFYDPVSHEAKVRQLATEFADFERSEVAILYAARGRLKLNRHGGSEGFYAPVYPEQARGGWLRRKSDRALRHHFLQGALAQAMRRSSESDKRATAEVIVDALRGSSRAPSSSEVSGKEILSAAVASVVVDTERHGLRSRDKAVDELVQAFGVVGASGSPTSLGDGDVFAQRIKDDFVALCALEGAVPRLLWLELLKCFLRLAVPAWILGRMKVAVMLRDWAVMAIESRSCPRETGIRTQIGDRWHDLFHPIRTGTNELAVHVERYMKARVELSILLYLLRSRGHPKLFESRLSVASPGATCVTVEALLQLFAATKIADDEPDGPRIIRPSLIRAAESFAAWTNPLKKGQGKNIDEFLRSLRRFEPRDDDTGYLAEKVERASPAQSIIFPGPSMIRLVLMLASREKARRHGPMGGKLVLADLERHFHEYGLEFAASAGARPRLISELSRLGLLRGSPDAGEYTELLLPIDSGSRISTGQYAHPARGGR